MPETRRVVRRSPRAAEEYDDEPPRSRRRPQYEEEAEERPTARRVARGRDEDEEPATVLRAATRMARGRRDDDDERRPSSRRRRNEDDDTDGLEIPSGLKGWSTVKSRAPSKFSSTYKFLEEGEGLIMFLEDEPYADLLRHWCDWAPKGTKKGYVCLQTFGRDDCPLCEVNQDPSVRALYNILDCRDEEPVLTTLDAGIQIQKSLEDHAKRSGPPAGQYYAVQMQDRGRAPKMPLIRPIKERDVEEDFGFVPISDEDFDKWVDKCYDKSVVTKDSKSTLQDIADLVAR